MKAIILAGGVARRLKPITNDLPKCLLNIGGQTIIDRQIESLFTENIDEIIIVTGFKSELLKQHIELNHSEKKITIIKNLRYESTGPAYGLWCAREYLGESDIIYLNGDLVCDHRVIKDLISSSRRSATTISRNKWDEEQVKIEIRPDRSVKALGKWIQASESYGEFVGATKISKELGSSLKQVLEKFKQNGEDNKFAADAINEAISSDKDNTMYILDVTNYRTIEIDTVSDFKTAGKMWQRKTRSKVKTFFKITLAWILNTFTYLIPRSNKKIIFIGWHVNGQKEIFADNSKYFFLHVHNKHKLSLRSIWITRDRLLMNTLMEYGMESYYLYSPRGVWHSVTSGFTVIDAHMYRSNWQFSGGSKIIQLWHGKGMKKSGLAKKDTQRKFSRLIFPELFQKYNFLVASSDYTAFLMADIFNMPKNKVLVSGLPRNDVIFGDIKHSDIGIDEDYQRAISEFKVDGAKKIIAYMPTFRRNSSNPLDQIDLNKMNELLEKENYRMIITLHPKFSLARYGVPNELKNIRIMGAGYDIYPLFNDIDVLVTDYSSLYVDYLLLDRPIIFYTYDRESYEKETGLYDDFDNLTPGPHIRTFNELLDAISSYNDNTWKVVRKKASDKLHAFKDGNTSKRILKEIINKK